MASIARSLETERSSREAPSKTTGALAGALTVVAFTAIHDLWITDIWFNVIPMVLSGALCGLSIVWSYQEAVAEHSWARWWGFNAACASLLIGLGGVSLLVFEPRFTMAELIDADDALARVLPPAMPLIVTGTIVGTLVLWMVYERRRRALFPLLVTQGLLMFLVGHNLAILGLVDIPNDQLFRVFEFVGLTIVLAGLFAAGAMVVGSVRTWSNRTSQEQAGHVPRP